MGRGNRILDEIDAHAKNITFPLGHPPAGKIFIPTRWVLTIKRGAQGQILKHKARWVLCQGFRQQEGVDYDETFASVVRSTVSKALLALAAKYDYETEQIDVITAFLEAKLNEEVWVCQPPGYYEVAEKDETILACLLGKALYGPKQAPREWYSTLKTFLTPTDCERIHADHSVFVHANGIIIAIYVDDLLLCYLGQISKLFKKLKNQLNSRFRMKDLGPVAWYLGMQITRDRLFG